MKHIEYRAGYKYQLARDYIITLDIPQGEEDVELEHVSLSASGVLTIRAGYAWDGPSGPTIDTRNSLRASLVHDVLYQLIRLGYLPANYREMADDIFYEILVEDGMARPRAFFWKKMLRWFGGPNARPSHEKQILFAP